jgi:hypothetical protein
VSHTLWRNSKNESGMSLQVKQLRHKTGSATWLAEPASWRKVGGAFQAKNFLPAAASCFICSVGWKRGPRGS